MNRTAWSKKYSGFALAETLVAMLLLALATTGAGTAMLHSMAGQRSALLRMQAADLAADLAESLRAAPDPSTRQAEIKNWQLKLQQQLPRATAQAVPRNLQTGVQPSLTAVDILLQWRDGQSPVSTLTLPVTLGTEPDAG